MTGDHTVTIRTFSFHRLSDGSVKVARRVALGGGHGFTTEDVFSPAEWAEIVLGTAGRLPDHVKGTTAAEVLAWDRGWRACAAQAPVEARTELLAAVDLAIGALRDVIVGDGQGEAAIAARLADAAAAFRAPP